MIDFEFNYIAYTDLTIQAYVDIYRYISIWTSINQ